MKKRKIKKIGLTFLIFIIIIANLYFFSLRSPKEREIVVHNYKLNVELPTNSAGYLKGLSGRKFMAENQGMLFIFPREDYLSFWMPEMNFPLDILWLDKDCQVIYIEKNIPPCKSRQECPVMKPDKLSQYVLETVAGFADKHHVLVGEKLEICYLVK